MPPFNLRKIASTDSAWAMSGVVMTSWSSKVVRKVREGSDSAGWGGGLHGCSAWEMGRAPEAKRESGE